MTLSFISSYNMVVRYNIVCTIFILIIIKKGHQHSRLPRQLLHHLRFYSLSSDSSSLLQVESQDPRTTESRVH